MTIIEVGVAVSLTAVVASVAVSALIEIKRVDQSISRSRADHAGALQLADRLRDDVHRATVVAWDADHQELGLEFPHGEIATYLIEEGRAERRLLQAPSGLDADRPASLPASDEKSAALTAAYRISHTMTWSVSPAHTKLGDIATIGFSIDERSIQRGKDDAALMVRAVVGKYRQAADQ